MNLEIFYEYCLSKKGVTEHFPFDQDTLVFKVGGKMFVLSSLLQWENGAAQSQFEMQSRLCPRIASPI